MWYLVYFLALAIQIALLPFVEFTSDEGVWLLDAYFRLKESDWLTAHITTSQGIPFSPLVSWLLAIPLAIYPSATSVQILLLGSHLMTIFFVQRIGRRLRMYRDGILPALLIISLPALALNASSKISNTGFILFASSIFFWARLCHFQKSSLMFSLGALFFAVQVHYSFLVFLFPLILDFGTQVFRRKPLFQSQRKVAIFIGAIAAVLLFVSAFSPEPLRHLRSLLDMIAPTSDYMTSRSKPVHFAAYKSWFVPWELVPLFAALVLVPMRTRVVYAPRRVLWLYFCSTVIVLGLLTFYPYRAAHQWTLAWIVPFVLLTSLGLEYIAIAIFRGRKFVPMTFACCLVGLSLFQTFQLAHSYTQDGDSGWHGTSLSRKREILSYLHSNYPDSRIWLTVPDRFNSYTLMGWVALVSLPGEFLKKVAVGKRNVIFLEEQGTTEVTADLSQISKYTGWKPIKKFGSVQLWLAEGIVNGEWPRVEPKLER